MTNRFGVLCTVGTLTFAIGQADAQELPVPCVSCTAGPGPFVSSGNAGYVVSGNTGTVTQTSERAILNWQSFNIGAGGTVNFVQPNSTSAALNRIFQADPSRIFGTLNANGQVYLINQNGILFGGGSQVNAASLVASTLNVTDRVFNGLGIVGAINNDLASTDPNAALAAFEGSSDASISIAQGARLKGSDRIVIVASDIENRGRLETPGGQAILAASHDKVYLASDRELGGLLVEVDTGGSVSNLGEILAERGNVTLAGLAVNQSGLISATTSVSAGGSIRLLARDGATALLDTDRVRKPIASRTGTLVLGTGSTTEVLPDRASTETAIDLQAQPLSRIDLAGGTIEMRSGSSVVATGGNVSLQVAPGANAAPDFRPTIYMADGSRIDVSGDDTSSIAMERNEGRVKLFGNELADSPVQRDGPLARQEISVDLRYGTRITDISRLRDDIKRGVSERLSAGGSVMLDAQSSVGADVILDHGSTIDFSGGQVSYRDGFITTTKLVGLNGDVVDIANADPNTPYAGIYGNFLVEHERWGITEQFAGFGGGAEFHAGYVEGKDAGKLSINATGIVANGTLLGNTTSGALQRTLPVGTGGVNRTFTQLPLGGLLDITRRGVLPDETLALDFTNEPIDARHAFGTPLADDQVLTLSSDALFSGGINRLRVDTPGTVRLPEDVSLNLAAGAEVTLTGDDLDVAGDIQSATGRVAISSRAVGTRAGSVVVRDSATIDVSGTWVNDLPDVNDGQAGTAPLTTDGGQVTITSRGDLTLEAGSLIDVSGGAQLRANGSIDGGSGGVVSLASTIPGQSTATSLTLDGTLRGYGFDKGGTLRLSAGEFRIGDPQPGMPGTLPALESTLVVDLAPDFFGTGGFASYELTADRGSIEVAPGSQIDIAQRNLQLLAGAQSLATGANLDAFAQLTTLPDPSRAATSFSATVVRTVGIQADEALLRIGAGSTITTEAGGSIALASDSDLTIDGALTAHGGSIRATLNNPDGANETGFRPEQALRLGADASLDVSGVGRTVTDGFGIRSGDVLNGGQVVLSTDRGFIVASGGSNIDVSGAQVELDLPDADFGALTPTSLASDAGAIRVTAAEGALMFGDLHGAPGAEGAAGGTLAVTLDATRRDPNDRVFLDPALPQFPTAIREIVVGGVVTGSFPEGVPITAFLQGKAILSAERIADGHFDVIDLAALPLTRASSVLSAGAIRFDGAVALNAGRRITLDASVISSSGQDARVRAPYVSIGLSQAQFETSTTPIAGGGSLFVEADHIDLRGQVAFSGFAQGGDVPAIRFHSTGDIRMLGTRRNGASTDIFTGSLTSLADLEFRADQIFPSTLTDYSIRVLGTDGRILIGGGDESAIAPSAAGALHLSAAEIVQGGILRAPFGLLDLDASRELTLADGSITSTSGAGVTVPFGSTEFGETWVYDLVNVTRVQDGAPEKAVRLSGPSIDIADGSLVDVSGGGDLLASEFVRGPGGTRDILLGNNPEGSFAIVPGWSLFGAYDPIESTAAGIQTGSTIELAGGNGIPAGVYARLPARYALLPGAFLVTPTSGARSVDTFAGSVAADGVTALVSGRSGFAGTDIHAAQWSSYSVMTGSQVRQRAEYKESLASKFFTGDAISTRDAGRLAIEAERTIRIDGSLAAAAASGRAAQVDFVADNLAVVHERSDDATRVELVDSELQNFGAASLLLGGTRSTTTDGGMKIDVSANSLAVEDGAALTAPELMLAARNEIRVESGARLDGRGAAPARTEFDPTIAIAGDGAFVRASAGQNADVIRTGVSGAAGLVTVEAGATIAASGSIVLDSTRDVVSEGDLLASGGSLSLVASRINIGDAPDATAGLTLSREDLETFDAAQLIMRSRSTIDFFGDLDTSLNSVRLDAAGIRGIDDAQVQLAAREFTVGNSRGVALPTAGTGTGSFSFSGETLNVGAGAFDVSGFSSVGLRASNEIVGQDLAQLNVRGDLTLAAARITGSSGADAAISATGTMQTEALAPPASLAPVEDLGARLTLTAASVNHGGRIELPSGIVQITATGPDGITLATGSTITTEGRSLNFAGTIVGSNGGSVSLAATQGPINLDAGARVDVSAGADGDAGAIAISARNGDVRIAGDATLVAHSQDGAGEGSFSLDARSLSSGFSALNTSLNDGGFTQRRAVALGTGDVSVAAGETVRAHEIDLAANGGRIDVAGVLDARGASGGSVRLNARDGVAIAANGTLDAGATANGHSGGRIELGTRNGVIDSRGTISVSGRDANGVAVDDGHVSLRAPRVGSSGIGIAALGDIEGAGRVDLEGVAHYTAGTINTTLLGTMRADTSAFMANAAAIEQGLGVDGDDRFHLVTGVEVFSPGDLTLNTPWDLFNWRDAGEAGVLTLRATGNLQLNQSLSDGFATVALDVLPERDVVQTGPSWSYRLVAGADAASADPLAVVNGVGSVTIGNNARVRTGTGSIDVAAGNDLVLATAASALYTTGVNRGTGALDPFDAEVLLRADFVENGGDVRVRVGRDVRGVTNQPLPDYMPRLAGEFIDYRPGIDFPAMWASDASRFTQGIGTLGGGDVDIVAGGSMDNMTLALPTNALPYAIDGSDTRVAGGGNLDVAVGGDVRGGVYVLGRGHGEIRAGGSIGESATGMRLAPIVGLGDADINLEARRGVTLETVFNPTVAEQNPEQGLLDVFVFPIPTYLFTYTDRSAVSMTTAAGDAVLRANGSGLRQPANSNRQIIYPELLSLFPGSLSARALQGDVQVQSRIDLFPSADGQLELLAGSDVTAKGAGAVNLSDGDVSLLPNIDNPASGLTTPQMRSVLEGHAPTPVHASDDVPALIVAREGRVGPTTVSDGLSFTIAKQTRISAGTDVNDLSLRVQHARDTDVTEVVAGRDIVYTTNRDARGNLGANSNVISVAGPGRVDLVAGRDVDFGSAAGVETRGDVSNPALDDSGADLSIWTGQASKPEFTAFTQRYLRDSTSYATALHAYLQKLGVASGSSEVDTFEALPEYQRREFLGQVLFAEIKRGGLSENKIAFDAIKTMFPPAQKYAGDLRSFLSHIRTIDGGNISLIVPGGLVNAGVASSGAFSKTASELGVLAQRDGDVNAFTRYDFLVNASRVFALDGGDILIWSSEGNIDAGRGARSALAIPPPVTTFDAQGNVVIEFPAAVSGSGIRAAVTTQGRKPGDVFLFAPAGVVDAGEAGIGSAGNITIVATEVIGADNIEVGGVAVGIPVDTGGLSASLAGVSSVASSASSSTLGEAGPENDSSNAPLAEATLGWLDVFVLGFGDETCKPDDAECLKRNRK